MNPSARRVLAGLAGLGLLATATACAPGGGAIADGKPSIVVGAYPFEFAATRVTGELAEVTNLLPPGSDGHDLELSPQQVASVGEADLVVYQSGYQTSFDTAVEQQAPAQALDTATFLALLTADGHAADEGHDGEAGHDEHEGHDHGDYDPHVWQDPKNIAEIGTHIAEKLAELDPDNGETYRANAATLSDEMAALDEQFSTGLTNCRTETFVTNHAAFGYLANSYGLHMVGISGLSTEEEPSPARIAEVQQIAQDNDLTTIFYETAVSPKVAETIAEDLGLTTDVLDPLGTLSDDSRGADYIEVMTSNLEALRRANGCQ